MKTYTSRVLALKTYRNAFGKDLRYVRPRYLNFVLWFVIFKKKWISPRKSVVGMGLICRRLGFYDRYTQHLHSSSFDGSTSNVSEMKQKTTYKASAFGLK